MAIHHPNTHSLIPYAHNSGFTSVGFYCVGIITALVTGRSKTLWLGVEAQGAETRRSLTILAT